MNVGLGLPISDPTSLLTWARRADAGPFSTLGLLDRLVHDNPEPLVTLALLAGATDRVRLQTGVLIAPLREAALLAKQAATLDQLSAGRFTLGIGTGSREDDYRAAGVDLRGRGRRLDAQLAVLRRIWAGEPYGEGVGPIGPSPARPGGPRLLFGGFTPRALDRVARWGDGFLGSGAPTHLDGLFRTVERSWQQAGRAGRPHLVAQVNVAVGPEAVVSEARTAAGSYYAFSDDYARQVVAGMLTSPEAVRSAVAAFGDLGADEVMLYCWSADPDQVDRIGDLVV